MNCYNLKPISTVKKSDSVFLAKVPIMPNQYLFKKQAYNLALLKGDEGSPLLLITDADRFWERYEEYYRARFEVEIHGDDFKVPGEYEVIYGKVRFDNESDAEAPEEGDNQEKEYHEEEERD